MLVKMTELLQVYRCKICGNIVELVHSGAGELVCCGQPMKLQTENTVDADHEKHVPVIEKTENGYLIKIGQTPHPMTQEHYIEWIEIITESGSHKNFLKPNDKPESEFCISNEPLSVRAYCNLHRLWKK